MAIDDHHKNEEQLLIKEKDNMFLKGIKWFFSIFLIAIPYGLFMHFFKPIDMLWKSIIYYIFVTVFLYIWLRFAIVVIGLFKLQIKAFRLFIEKKKMKKN